MRDLIAGKRCWTTPQARQKAEAKLGFKGWHERGYLPHRDAPDLVQFVTFRLADSFPAEKRREWEALVKVQEDLERRRLLETYLDKGRGECRLRNPEIADLVDSAFRFYHGKYFGLEAWVIMPNHVHALLAIGGTTLAKA